MDRAHAITQELCLAARGKELNLAGEPQRSESLPEPAIGQAEGVGTRGEAKPMEHVSCRATSGMRLALDQEDLEPSPLKSKRCLEACQAGSNHRDAPGLHRTSSDPDRSEEARPTREPSSPPPRITVHGPLRS
jgi:hypothetical protein